MTGHQVTCEDVTAWLRAFADAIAENADILAELDSTIGDADHGSNMLRGTKAVMAMLDGSEPESPGPLLKQVGRTIVSSVGGSSGPLYGTFFLRMGVSAGTEDTLDATAYARAWRAGGDGVAERGRTSAGDKTMYDALAPAIDALDRALAAGAELPAALRTASTAADAGRDATADMAGRKGRASYLGERSVGHADPGATSMALLVAAAARTAS